jgi:hypothetical protein
MQGEVNGHIPCRRDIRAWGTPDAAGVLTIAIYPPQR